jgi:hypothetical protein
MLISARNNQFRFSFPRNFIPTEIASKYKSYFGKIPGSLIKEPIDFFNYGIQSINLPGPSFTPVEQKDNPGDTRNFRSSFPRTELFDRSMTVTMQAFDGWINYWMAVELFEHYYNADRKPNGKYQYLPEGVGIQMIDGEGYTLVTVQLKDMLMTGVSALDLNFSSNTIEFKTFEINFVYNDLDIVVNLT